MKLRDLRIDVPGGVQLLKESTDNKVANLQFARGVRLNPMGALSRAPDYDRLWTIPRLVSVASTLGLTADDLTCLLRVRNEGHVFLVFYDVSGQRGRGIVYAGIDPDDFYTANPTLTVSGAQWEVLWRKLDPQAYWKAYRFFGEIVLGNRVDDSLIYSPSPPTIRKFGDSIRPLAPVCNAIDIVENVPVDAKVAVGSVTFYALEPAFTPVSEETYRRAEGNNIIVAAVQGAQEEFSSSLDGRGTRAEPYSYVVYCPKSGNTYGELVEWIARDPKAAGIVTAKLTDADSAMSYFHDAHLAGGVTAFDASDVFASSQVDVVLTYFRRGPAGKGLGQETAPTKIITVTDVGSKRLQVRVTRDIAHPRAGDYDAIRIYVSPYTVTQTQDTFTFDGEVATLVKGETTITDGFATKGYRAFQLALEVPNADGTHTIAPSLLRPAMTLDGATQAPPPFSIFVQHRDRGYLAGNPAAPLRLYRTRRATTDARLPENIQIGDWWDLPASQPNDEIVAVAEYYTQLLAYTKDAVFLIPDDTAQAPSRAAVHAGAASQQSVINWTNGFQYYLGQDLSLYRISLPDQVTGSNQAQAPVSELMAPFLGKYLNQFCDTTQMSRAHSYVDYTNKEWWLWIPGASGAMKAFVYSFGLEALTGPIDLPGFVATTALSIQDNRIIGVDHGDNIMVMPLNGTQDDREMFTNAAGLTTYASGAAVPSGFSESDGFGLVAMPDGQFIIKGQVIEARTGWLYLAGGSMEAGVYEIFWDVVDNSAGIAEIIVYSDQIPAGQSYSYGEVFGRARHFLQPGGVPGTRHQVLWRFYVGDGRPFALRSLGIKHREHGPSI